MESIGKKLREAREKNGFNIDQVARETHISKRYLRALEEEDFSIFPGETYTIGFLRNYAEYLGINAEEIVNLYKNLKIQEQPVPIDELLDVKKKGFPIGRLLIIILIIALVGGGGYFGYKYITGKTSGSGIEAKKSSPSGSSTETAKNKIFVFEEEALNRWFDDGETIRYPVGNAEYDVKISEIKEDIKLESAGKVATLKLGQAKFFDFNGDNQPDLKILVNDIDKSGRVSRVNLGLYKITRPVKVAAATGENANRGEAEGESSQSESSQRETTGVSSAAVVSGVIAENANPFPFKMDFQFRGYCFFRYTVDDSDRVEKFFHKGEFFSIDVKNRAMLWISNAGVIKAKVAGKDVQLGRPGQVVTKKILWKKNEEKKVYQLQIIDVY